MILQDTTDGPKPLFEIQVNGNFDEKGNDRINEGQVAAYYRRASSMDPENPEYLASHAKALLEFDRISMSVREFRKLKDLGDKLDDLDVSSHFYEAAQDPNRPNRSQNRIR